jgi:hypothetical protein
MDYQTEEVPDLKHKKPSTWIVRCPDGSIANGYHHKTIQEANKHRDICRAFCRNREDGVAE